MNAPQPHIASRPRRRARVLTAIAAAAALALSACGGDDSDSTSDATPSGAAIEVTDVWARSSPMVATAGAAYMLITNNGSEDDALLAASVADDVAGAVELHQSRAVEPDMGDDMTGGDMGTTDSTMAPMMEMVPVDRIELPAGGTASLQPGGYHVMLLDLVAPLTEGDQLELTLSFEVAGEVVVTAVVGDGAP